MTYQEKQSIVNICSGLLITAIYSFLIYQKHIQGQFDLTQDFKAWGIILLIYIGVSIISRIFIYIIFTIINSIVTRQIEKIPIVDEREKLIKLKSSRNGYVIFSIGCILLFTLLAFGMPIYKMFIVFVIFGLLAEIIDNSSQIYYHRKGI